MYICNVVFFIKIDIYIYIVCSTECNFNLNFNLMDELLFNKTMTLLKKILVELFHKYMIKYL